ncbi:MAG: hypothetical protein H3C47_13535 [Candidatus Cloacimonetes bacterium]|nr:hypothetical protein [Candidatus Cloacimonadota bacterium]
MCCATYDGMALTAVLGGMMCLSIDWWLNLCRVKAGLCGQRSWWQPEQCFSRTLAVVFSVTFGMQWVIQNFIGAFPWFESRLSTLLIMLVVSSITAVCLLGQFLPRTSFFRDFLERVWLYCVMPVQLGYFVFGFGNPFSGSWYGPSLLMEFFR